MKIGIYADMHASLTSSIMPLSCKNSNWTSRLEMVRSSFVWMNDLFEKEGVSLIVNCGDMFDSHMLNAQELSLFSSLKKLDIPTYHLVGNHEIFNGKYYSCSILRGDNSFVIDSPSSIVIDNVKLGFLPYMRAEDINSNVLKRVESDILFSHIDIKGSRIRKDYIMDVGVEPSLLTMYSNHVINGHLHTYEIVTKNDDSFVMNVGSITSKSFSDNNNYLPHIMILDTNDMSYRFYDNPNAILFRKVVGNSSSDVLRKVESFIENTDYSYILRISCPYEFCDTVRKKLQNISDKILAYRVIGKIENKNEIIKSDGNKIGEIDDIKEEFLKFLDENSESLKFNIEDYKKIISEI